MRNRTNASRRSWISASATAAVLVSGLTWTGCAPHQEPEPATSEAPALAVRPAVADPADWCAGHGLPESMCTKCNPGLAAEFQAAGDWCAEHGYPESACPTCNPMAPPSGDRAAADWCAGHGLPESMCTKCNPGLAAEFQAAGDWCAEHGYPESACPTCNPKAPPGGDRAAADWCAGHGLPESMCTKCNPELRAGFQASGDWCAEHAFPESACPLCNPVTPPGGDVEIPAVLPGTRVRFRSQEIERAAGIEVQPARPAAMDEGLEVPARIGYDRNRMAHVRSPLPATVRQVLADLGERVSRGTPLFVLDSPAVGDLQGRFRAAKERLIAARANHERQSGLRREKIASARAVELARQELEAAEGAVRALEQTLDMSGAGSNMGRPTLRAPLSGTVVERPAVIGFHAGPDDLLATVADTSRMWALLEIPEGQAHRVRLGQPVRISIEGMPDTHFGGEVTWIASEVDLRTRSVTARAEVPNPDASLRAGQFATARISLQDPQGAVAVHRDALQRLGEDDLVFVRTGRGLYEPRLVSPGRRHGELVQIQGAVFPGDEVVTTGAFLLKTEISKESIGSGCCEVEAPGGG